MFLTVQCFSYFHFPQKYSTIALVQNRSPEKIGDKTFKKILVCGHQGSKVLEIPQAESSPWSVHVHLYLSTGKPGLSQGGSASHREARLLTG